MHRRSYSYYNEITIPTCNRGYRHGNHGRINNGKTAPVHWIVPLYPVLRPPCRAAKPVPAAGLRPGLLRRAVDEALRLGAAGRARGAAAVRRPAVGRAAPALGPVPRRRSCFETGSAGAQAWRSGLFGACRGLRGIDDLPCQPHRLRPFRRSLFCRDGPVVPVAGRSGRRLRHPARIRYTARAAAQAEAGSRGMGHVRNHTAGAGAGNGGVPPAVAGRNAPGQPAAARRSAQRHRARTHRHDAGDAGHHRLPALPQGEHLARGVRRRSSPRAVGAARPEIERHTGLHGHGGQHLSCAGAPCVGRTDAVGVCRDEPDCRQEAQKEKGKDLAILYCR